MPCLCVPPVSPRERVGHNSDSCISLIPGPMLERVWNQTGIPHFGSVVISVAHSKKLFHQVQKGVIENCGRFLVEGAMVCESFKQ